MTDEDSVHFMAQVKTVARAAAAVIDSDEQLEEAIVSRNAEYADLMATQRRKGHRWAKGHSVQELADLIARELRAMGYSNERQRAHGVTVDTLRKFAT